MASTTSDRILRFQLGDRIEHMVQLVTFVGLGLTGLIQKFHDSAISQWWIDFLGGLPSTRYIHRVLATILMVAVVYHFGKAGYRRWVERRPSSMLPGKADWTAIKETVALLAGRRKEPVKQGRFSFAEKVEYWSFVWGTVLMIATGFMLWNPITTARFLPGDFIPAAKAAHGGEAILAVLAILVWHIYHVHIKHFNKSIFTGYISREEMIEEHALELEMIESGQAGPQATPAEQAAARKRFMPAFSVFAVAMLAATWWFVTYEETSIATIEPIEAVQAFKPLPPTEEHYTPPLSGSNPFPSTSTTAPGMVIPDTLTWDDPIGLLLGTNCGACHSATTAMGGLDLTEYGAAVSAEGVIVPGDADASSLVTTLLPGDHAGQLSDGELDLVVSWIDAGAPADESSILTTWSTRIGDIVSLRCGACHSDTVSSGGVDLSTLAAARADGVLIVPGDADASAMITTVEDGGHPGSFTPEELAMIRDWINAGAQ